MNKDEVLTIPKAAEKIAPDLGLSKYTVGAYMREAIRSNRLPAYKKGGKDRQYVRLEDVNAYKEVLMTFTPALQTADR